MSRASEKAYRKLIKAAQEAYKHGYAVIVWTPDEIPDAACIDDLEDRAISAGNDYLSEMGA